LKGASRLRELFMALKKTTDDQVSAYKYLCFQQKNKIPQNVPDILKNISNMVTYYCYDILYDLLTFTGMLRLVEMNDGSYSVNCDTASHKIYVESNGTYSCKCSFAISHLLPCRHILKFYEEKNKKLTLDQIHHRWHLGSSKRDVKPQFKQEIKSASTSTSNLPSTTSTSTTTKYEKVTFIQHPFDAKSGPYELNQDQDVNDHVYNNEDENSKENLAKMKASFDEMYNDIVQNIQKKKQLLLLTRVCNQQHQPI